MMTVPRITVVDYGMGNIWSVISALRYLGCDPIVSDQPEVILKAESLLLPGVGSFAKAIRALSDKGLDQAILEAVNTNGRKILGICLGMQLLGTRGSEDGVSSGLGLIPATVDRFSSEEVSGAKIPHIGFNLVHSSPDARLFSGLPRSADFYFVHSYRMLANGLPGLTSTCTYGADFMAAYEQDNVFATQFHPEKSQSNGLLLLRNFVTQ